MTWRQQFFQKRLRLGLWLGLFWSLIGAVDGLYSVLVKIEELRTKFLEIFGDAAIADAFRDATIVYNVVVLIVLGSCLVGQRTQWGKRYTAVWFLLFACSLNEFLGQVIATFFQIPISPDTLVFFGDRHSHSCALATSSNCPDFTHCILCNCLSSDRANYPWNDEHLPDLQRFSV
ncbi:hypothetical protein IQ254_31185 [Nodosilinea sp. LEGE 07088]|uniref:hypothetical protein n=1 Tax=Nodosilinea sp. LEGE 07088 TaxID=2777968 RepID=UPI00187E4052|nr:hypothetical protein [Nodosilinea sp. LEGE 07088]MBE9141598.1 hypothetical protein [Nodosilinea sp. LEGE 07088]